MTNITVVIGSCLCVLDAPFEHIFIGYRTKVRWGDSLSETRPAL